jgi:hypothetical protein
MDADGTVVQMERWCRWNGGADGNTPSGFLIFEKKNFTGFVGPPSPSTLCAGPAYPPSIDPARHESMGTGSQDQQQQPGSAAARGASITLIVSLITLT